MKISHRLILLVAICLYADILTYGQQWQYSLDKYGWHTAQVSAYGMTPDGVVYTTLSILHGCSPNEILRLKYIIPNAGDMKNFNFDDFDGPDPPVYIRKLKLMTIKLQFKSGYEALKIAIAGWLEPELNDYRRTFFIFLDSTTKCNFGQSEEYLIGGLITKRFARAIV